MNITTVINTIGGLRLRNIEDFFATVRDSPPITLTCCKASNGDPCQDYPRLLAFVKKLPPNGPTAGTITIGNKFYGKMSYKEQYKHIVRQIKDAYRFNGDIKYIATFELQNNGQLHAHLLLVGEYQSHFSDWFKCFGSRNTHADSFQPCKHPLEYFAYMLKEQVLPTVHNIQGRDIVPIDRQIEGIETNNWGDIVE